MPRLQTKAEQANRFKISKFDRPNPPNLGRWEETGKFDLCRLREIGKAYLPGLGIWRKIGKADLPGLGWLRGICKVDWQGWPTWSWKMTLAGWHLHYIEELEKNLLLVKSTLQLEDAKLEIECNNGSKRIILYQIQNGTQAVRVFIKKNRFNIMNIPSRAMRQWKCRVAKMLKWSLLSKQLI